MPKEKTPIKAGSVSPIKAGSVSPPPSMATSSAFKAPSPAPSMATSSAFKAPSPAEDHDIKLDKIKITPFSDAKDWESTLFELKLILRQVWRDSKLDIISYITDDSYAHSVAGSKSQIKADQLIYYILSAGSVRDSFARNTIIAAQIKTAIPYIPDNEGLLLLQHFNDTFVSND